MEIVLAYSNKIFGNQQFLTTGIYE